MIRVFWNFLKLIRRKSYIIEHVLEWKKIVSKIFYTRTIDCYAGPSLLVKNGFLLFDHHVRACILYKIEYVFKKYLQALMLLVCFKDEKVEG